MLSDFKAANYLFMPEEARAHQQSLWQLNPFDKRFFNFVSKLNYLQRFVEL